MQCGTCETNQYYIADKCGDGAIDKSGNTQVEVDASNVGSDNGCFNCFTAAISGLVYKKFDASAISYEHDFTITGYLPQVRVDNKTSIATLQNNPSLNMMYTDK